MINDEVEVWDVVDVAKDTAMSGLNSLWQRPEVNVVRGNLNSIYQQVTCHISLNMLLVVV